MGYCVLGDGLFIIHLLYYLCMGPAAMEAASTTVVVMLELLQVYYLVVKYFHIVW